MTTATKPSPRQVAVARFESERRERLKSEWRTLIAKGWHPRAIRRKFPHLQGVSPRPAPLPPGIQARVEAVRAFCDRLERNQPTRDHANSRTNDSTNWREKYLQERIARFRDTADAITS